MVNPQDSSRRVVTPDIVAELHYFGIMFYRPLPTGVITLKRFAVLCFHLSRKDLLMVLVMGIAGGLLGMLAPIMTGFVFGNVIPQADFSQLYQIIGGLCIAALSSSFFDLTRGIAMLRIKGKLDGQLQAAVWDRMLSLPMGFFRRFTVGDLASRAMGIDHIRQVLTGTTITVLMSGIFSIFSFILLFVYSGQLAWVATGLVLFIIAISTAFTLVQLKYQREILANQGKVSGLVLQLLTNLAKIRVAGAEQRAFAQWASKYAAVRTNSFTMRQIGKVMTLFSTGFPIICSGVIFWYVAEVMKQPGQTFTIGTYLAFSAAFGQFLSAGLALVGVLSSVLSIIPTWERMQPILTTKPEIDETRTDPGILEGAIELNSVTFRYQSDGPTIIDNISLQAKPGEFVELVGQSGCGKSTLLRLILGFDEPQSGSIFFDGLNLSSIDIQAVRSQIGVVLQSSRIMSGDIFTNIIGSSNLTLAEAEVAARMAGLEQDIKAMPMGMHTVIGEGGSTFSGGQRQRLLIARAIAGKPRIILFDEATSALDNETQAIVSRSLESFKATCIVIAHCLSTIINADRIYVMDAGRIVETGTYSELMAQKGAFAKLSSRQMA